jgi:hypothetical protein
MNYGITCVMVTGKTTERYLMARRSLQGFLEQRLPEDLPVELLIINDNPVPLLEPGEFEDQNVREINITKTGQTLGWLRNMGRQLCRTTHMMQWDDDDFSTPHRIAWQAAQTDFTNGEATIFRQEIHCNLFSKQAFVSNGKSSRVKGFAGTMLFPNASCSFPDLGKHEDTEFLLRFSRMKLLRVLDNDPALYIRFYHGRNTWSRTHVMKRKPGSRNMTRDEQIVVDQVLANYEGVCDGGEPKESV